MARDPFPGVLPHGPLTELVPGLWYVEGTLPNMALNRNMIVWRSTAGGLVIHSGVAMDDAGMAALEALGAPRVLIVPNEGHRLDAAWYKRRYPGIQVVGPAAARAKIEQVVPLDATCEEALGAHGVRWHVPDGMQDGYELVYELDLPGGGKALVFNDVLSLPKPAPGFGGFVLKLLGPPGGKLGLPRIVRFFFGKDMGRYRAFVARLAEIPGVVAMAFSHGGMFTGDCAGALRAAATRV